MWTAAALVVAAYAFFLGMHLEDRMPFSPEDQVGIFTTILLVFVLYTLLFSIARWLGGWQIAHHAAPPNCQRQGANQFRIKDLLVAAAIVATALGLGRSLIPFDRLEPEKIWDLLGELAALVAGIGLALLPLVPILGICLALRSGPGRLMRAPLVFWGAMNGLAAFLVISLNWSNSREIQFGLGILLALQSGYFLASYLSVWAINTAGYRLVQRKRNPPDPLECGDSSPL
jgi:hypothetical protein